MRTYAEDARPWLERSAGGYDAIMVDAYRQPYIPFYLATREFFELARDRLAPGGVVIVNVGHPEGSDDLERVLGRTMARGLPHGAAGSDRADQHAAGRRRGAALCRALRRNARSLPAGAAPAARDAAASLGAAPRGGEVYTDDRAPVEWLVDAPCWTTPTMTRAEGLAGDRAARAAAVAFAIDVAAPPWRGPARRRGRTAEPRPRSL